MVKMVHPGAHKYVAHETGTKICRVLYFTLAVVMHLSSIAARVLAQADHGESREVLCSQLLGEFNRTLPLPFTAAYQAAKRDLISAWAESSNRRREAVAIPAEIRAKLSDRAKERVLAGVKAEGLPESETRRKQVAQLLKSRCKDLFIRVQGVEWAEWAMKVAENKSYYMSALATGEIGSNADARMKLGAQILPAGTNVGAAMAHPDVRKEVFSAVGRRLKAGWTTEHFSPALQQARR
jgi:hypothetical protein